MSAETLSLLAGAVLSLLFSYVPGLSDWFEGLGVRPDGNYDDGARKRLVMLGLLVLASAAVFGLGCSGWGEGFGVAVTCDQAGLMGLLRALVLAIVANQGTHMIAKPPVPYQLEDIQEKISA